MKNKNTPSNSKRRQKHYSLKRHHNITIDQFEKMWDDQNGKCKICEIKMNKYRDRKNQRLPACIDHHHDTGVCWCKRTGKWIVSFNYKKKKYHIGYYDYKHEAAIKYNENVSKISPYFKLNEIKND